MTKDKSISGHDLKHRFHDGVRILYGGFMGCGTPDKIIHLILDSGAKNLTIIGNDTAFPDTGVELIPQGTLVERIRCGGAGLGGVLTPTGIGTEVEIGKTKISFDDVEYLVERPLRADIAIVLAQHGDRAGNLSYQRAARNFNPIIALAADFVVAEIVEPQEDSYLDPDTVMTPGALVDAYITSES